MTTLKDPSSFGPPPKNVNFHGGAALPDRITPDTRGLGAPLTQAQIQEAEEAEQARIREEQVEQEEAYKPAPPPVPYRADRTGLSTNHLPKPPVKRVDDDESSLPPTTKSKPKPSLPPRLPPRRSSNQAEPAISPPPYDAAVQDSAAQGQLNQGALNRLGKAGVSVPGFGIGDSNPNPWKNEPSSRSPSTVSATTGRPQLGELQSRFSKMSTSSQNSEPPNQGTTFEQKQAAFKTAQSFQKDPSSVSFSDARTAASTANNFRERHGEQVAAGAKKANAMNQKYNIGGRLNSFVASQTTSPPNEAPPQPASPSVPDASALAGRKPPPPPPPKKPQTHSPATSVQSPPPLPMGTKPRY